MPDLPLIPSADADIPESWADDVEALKRTYEAFERVERREKLGHTPQDEPDITSFLGQGLGDD